MMLCVLEILLKNGRKTGGNLSSMNLSSVASHARTLKRDQSRIGGHARKDLRRYKSTNLVSLGSRHTYLPFGLATERLDDLRTVSFSSVNST